MRRITPHLWFDTQAKEAAEFYTSLHPDSAITNAVTLRDTPSGDCDVVSFELAGQPFQAISAGPLFTFNPSISFTIACETADEVSALWAKLIDGGSALMELDTYPWSERYGWLADRYGVSWQISAAGGRPITQRIVPSLMFVGENAGKAEAAIAHYTSIFENSSSQVLMRYGADSAPDAEGTIQYATFSLEGNEFSAMDSAHEHKFQFNEAVSLIVSCKDQAEIDSFWNKLSDVQESEQCGWCKDRFGVSWQVVPAALDDMIANADDAALARVTQVLMPMKKLDVAALEAAYKA